MSKYSVKHYMLLFEAVDQIDQILLKLFQKDSTLWLFVRL